MAKITTILFDFGNVFINLDIDGATKNALQLFNIEAFTPKMLELNARYEKGLLTTKSFFNYYSEKFPDVAKEKIQNTWNFILKDFPEYRLQFLQDIAKQKKYQLILLSNTNQSHISYIQKNVSFYTTFKNCFDAFYLSYKIHLRKPNAEIFQFVVHQNKLQAKHCLFIDDFKETTEAAKQLGFNVWNLKPKTEDVSNLFLVKKELF